MSRRSLRGALRPWLLATVLHRLPSALFAALCVSVAAPVAATSAPTFSSTLLPAGGYEYFFAAPSLVIRSARDIDLTGLSYIEGEDGGFRVVASFVLDSSENGWARQMTAIDWLGSPLLPRSLTIDSGGELNLGNARLTLHGGTIVLSGQTLQTDGAILDVGSGALVIGVGSTVEPGRSLTFPPREGGASGASITVPGGNVMLNTPAAPVPEPSHWALLLGGLGLLGTVVRRTKAP